MVRQREFNEDEVLEAAMLTFWEKGFEATSLSDLTARMGIQRPSIYSAFGDKQQLFEAALRKYASKHAAEVRSKLQSQSSAKAALREYFRGLVAEEYEGGDGRGCFCINTMVELAPHDERFEILTREHQMYLATIFQETLERGVQSGELGAQIQPRVLAQTFVIFLIGLTVMMKSRPERIFLDNAVATLLTLLD
ncbi:TetR/AcrR family transcriptional regulator [Paenibacillus donghaensis]|uniref:TetR family transcriptional regulator n=1 Tax=Paenibacillus donghaensis TaxID=414771 RepID=A0A2Z2K3A2_9BACL|nr:TetR/AcrR family transcriptional regulator [Paenibacillus donghaensis]ASA19716.1 TetR family transcriptional regulator [Paenibacillus donghaensis]